MLCPKCFSGFIERARRGWWEKLLASVFIGYRGPKWRCVPCGRQFFRAESAAPASEPDALSHDNGFLVSGGLVMRRFAETFCAVLLIVAVVYLMLPTLPKSKATPEQRAKFKRSPETVRRSV